ncbi:hypothetical protein Hypma_013706 [Hypsizygus marmoreus]|uniref:Uncharacterized protein n=1 Tax=Hypsizygus marmoreus TaxID=39966 RepID=A0A369JIM0_HYPMA|nr:hypothetical protein Hypma_013706 [Hypsizygus marmoreus]
MPLKSLILNPFSCCLTIVRFPQALLWSRDNHGDIPESMPPSVKALDKRSQPHGSLENNTNCMSHGSLTASHSSLPSGVANWRSPKSTDLSKGETCTLDMHNESPRYSVSSSEAHTCATRLTLDSKDAGKPVEPNCHCSLCSPSRQPGTNTDSQPSELSVKLRSLLEDNQRLVERTAQDRLEAEEAIGRFAAQSQDIQNLLREQQSGFFQADLEMQRLEKDRQCLQSHLQSEETGTSHICAFIPDSVLETFSPKSSSSYSSSFRSA